MAGKPLTSKSSDFSAQLTAESRRNLERLAKADLMPDLRKEVMSSTQPLVSAVKEAARHKVHAPGQARTRASLSSQIANAVGRSVVTTSRQVTAQITLTCKGNLSNLARSVEGIIPWEHPTFGHDPKVRQRPRPFFYATLETLTPRVANQIERVLSKLEKKL